MIIKCPQCWKEGKVRNLAEILPDGMVKIQRFHTNKPNGERQFTLIEGNELSLICGECQFKYNYRKEGYAVRHFRPIWVHRVSFIQGSIIQEAFSRGSLAGTTLSA